MGKITARFGQHDEKTMDQLEAVAKSARFTAIMADGHLGYVMPIGGVAGYVNQVSPVGVGFDIACGNAAIMTNLKLAEIGKSEEDRKIELNKVADEIASKISFGIGRNNNADDAPTDHSLFDSPAWNLIPGKHEKDSLKAKARNQLGTVGSGNHYVDVFVDEQDRIWIGVHFGSRGFGHTTATGFLNLAQGREWNERNPKEVDVLLSLDTEMGHSYWQLMELAGEYAYVGREWVARKVLQILGAAEVDLVHNHHNFAWREKHHDEDLIVVRKGATPAFPGQKGFIGGSMGDDAVIVEGATLENGSNAQIVQEDALYSTVHGAGRVMSRTEARGKVKRKTGQIIRPGKVSPEMMREWIEKKGVILRGGGLDESPHAYRRLPDVLEAQGPTITVLHTLRPLIVAMAGANEFDPYKD